MSVKYYPIDFFEGCRQSGKVKRDSRGINRPTGEYAVFFN